MKKGLDCNKIFTNAETNSNLYLGSSKISKDKEKMKELKMFFFFFKTFFFKILFCRRTHILNLAGKCLFEDSFTYLKTHFSDSGENETKFKEILFDECIPFIDKTINTKNNNLLVHCLGGISR